MANELFLKAAKPPISSRAEAQHFFELVSILDVVMAGAMEHSAPYVLNKLRTLWPLVIGDWPAYQSGQWADAAGLIARALASDGPDRKFVITDFSFARSATKLWLMSEQKGV